MRVAKIDTRQSWLIEIGSDRILINPLALDPAMLQAGKWSMAGDAGKDATLPKIHLVVISSDSPAHLSIAALQQLGPNMPIYTTPKVAKTLRLAGFQRVTSYEEKPTLKSKNTHIAGLPIDAISSKQTAAFFVKETERKATAFIVPFGAKNYPIPNKDIPIDFFLAPATDLKRWGRPLTKSAEMAVAAATILKPRAFAPIGVAEKLPWQTKLVDGDALIKRGFALAKLDTSILTPVPGKATEIFRL